MTLDDCHAVAEVRVRGWQVAYAGLMPQAHLDAMSVARDAVRRREMFGRVPEFVAERDGAVVGWACHGPSRDRDVPPGEAELYALYAHPGHLSTGVGRALLDTCAGAAAHAGHSTMRLWVLEGNARARRFYERAGFVTDGAREPYEVGGVRVPEVRYVRKLGPAPRKDGLGLTP
ncbi:GNAT family N-acetyltransferase [Streptomyces kunmingensis]|uniref:GNAT family N-acetyltransferase n=1 Tax=Streptomyces kunmingensis TaxID=68225 RepID=A0ABU6CKM0_9ACTN|nr:GNAT family N-acetyltransferase [Streptomyces kunmingensis]MEB3965274.1 GNAT family N-acetyltransferase [Streptomyces kunmingensis]